VFRRARLVAACLVVVLGAAACAGDDDGGAIPGDPHRALTVEYETFSGDTTTLEAYRGTPTVVNFWASWCTPCITEMPDFEAVHQEAGDQVAFVGLSTDFKRSDAEEMAERTGVTYDLGYDSDETIVREFVTVGLPITVFVDADGNVTKVHSGPLAKDKLRGLIRDELGVEL
jgi:cytochrome c biogenesis protein CcmG/thiol:disulfide interchange protein DsbE